MNGKNRRNYYRLLHVQPDAPTEVIKSNQLPPPEGAV